jgi:hypothetical protein
MLVRAELLGGPALVDEHVVACLDCSGHEWLEIADVVIQRGRPSPAADFFASFPGCSLLLTNGAVYFRDGRCVLIRDDAEWILASVLYFWEVVAHVPSARIPGDVRLTILSWLLGRSRLVEPGTYLRGLWCFDLREQAQGLLKMVASLVWLVAGVSEVRETDVDMSMIVGSADTLCNGHRLTQWRVGAFGLAGTDERVGQG